MDLASYVQKVYQELHAHPELSSQEAWTASYVARELKQMGFAISTQVGGHGVVGLLDAGRPGLTLGLRSDMDALPMGEETGVSYASQIPGVMHACGHDSHMAMVLAACRYAAENKERLQGKLLAVFQPAEEVGDGAKAMLEAGVFAQVKPDRFVGIHNWPSLGVGSLGLQSGPLTANTDSFTAVFRGVGGHGALPHRTKDAIAMATAGVQNAFALTQRYTDASYPQVVSFGVIQGGTTFNIIPETVTVAGTVRTMRLEDQEQMIRLLHQAFRAAADLYGGSYGLDYAKGVPGVVNDAQVAAELAEFFAAQLPDVRVVSEGLASLVGEDVGYFLQEVPGVLLFVGSGREGAVNELHNPRFLVPAEALVTGFRALVSIIEGYLA
ncbi:MAG TPA: M20 family metallopeptidase [Limnochordia bacterium]|nr:M20 family metallopeptidase [Limnochordia bacterium]